MGLKFNVQHKHRLDNEQKRKYLPPRETLLKLGLREGDVMADVGCGIGYFTIPAAEIVGETGKVFAMDISTEMIHEVKEKIKEKHLTNVIPIVTEENDLKVEDALFTYTFISTVLHEVDDIHRFLHEVKRIMADDGKIVVIEWQKRVGEWGPPVEHRLDPWYTEKMLQESGFQEVTVVDLNEHFYSVAGRKYRRL